jgi:hypothetical protein
VTIHLDPEQERIIGLAIQAGLIRDVEDVVKAGVETMRLRLEAPSALSPDTDAALWAKELHEWVSGHSNSSRLLSDEAISRDSIYKMRDF